MAEPWRAPEQVERDIIRLSLPYQHGFVNSFVVLGTDGPRLIDTGTGGGVSRSGACSPT